MSEQYLSKRDLAETLEHFVLSFSSVTNVNDLTHEELEKAHVNIQQAFGDGSEIKPLPEGPKGEIPKPKLRKLHRKGCEKMASEIMSAPKSLSKHILLCDACLFMLKRSLKNLNSLTKSVIKGCLMKKHPELINLNEIASGVYDVFSYQKQELKSIIKTEESKLEELERIESNKRKKKDDLKSLFFKKRGALKASLMQRGKKNPECMLRAYELLTLKMPCKSGELLHSQQEVADALVGEGLIDKCSQQSVSRWNDLVERELNH